MNNFVGVNICLRAKIVKGELNVKAEARTFGQTQKDGAASVMQAAAELNVKAGFVEKDAHSQVAEKGVMAQEILVPGMYNYFHDNVIDLVYAIRLRVCFLNHCNFMPPTFTRH